MLDSMRSLRPSAAMLKYFLLTTLLYPVYTSAVGSAFAPDFILANAFVLCFCMELCVEGNVDWKKRNFLIGAILWGLLGFNAVCLYTNYNFFNWYAGQVNASIPFLLLLALLMTKEEVLNKSDATIKFILGAGMAANLVGMIPYLFGYGGVTYLDANIFFIEVKKSGWFLESYSGVYWHKSEYSFAMVLFLALAVTYRRLFKKKLAYYCYIGVLLFCLVIANTRTTMAAVLFIFAGMILDKLNGQGKLFSKRSLTFLSIIAGVGAILLYFFSKERDILSLGYRTYIWKEAVAQVLDNPFGLGPMFGLQTFPVEGISFEVWNGHNVFLNILLQFSTPAGIFYIGMFLALIVAAIRENRSFRTVGIWIALLIPMTMDWCLLLIQMPMAMLMLYCIFFHPRRNVTEEETL